MLKTTIRFVIVALIAAALGFLIYHLNQSAATASFGQGFREFGERGFGEGSFSLMRGLFGIAGNVFMIAIVTVIVVALQKAFRSTPQPAGMR